MSVNISRQIGWDQEDILLYEIAKKLDLLIKLKGQLIILPEEIALLLENGGSLLSEDGTGFILE